MNTTTPTSAVLEVLDNNGNKSRYDLKEGAIIIGRLDSADIQLDSNTVSRQHAQISYDSKQGWMVRDLASHNGTFVNSKSVSEAKLTPQDTIEIDEFTLRLIDESFDEKFDINLNADPNQAQDTEATFGTFDSQDDAIAISSLHQVEPAHVASKHLSTLSEFAESLIVTKDDNQRLIALCQLTVGENFHADAAVVLRLNKNSDAKQPLALCPMQLRDKNQDQASAHISRTLLKAVMSHIEPVMASNTGDNGVANGGGTGIELSIAQNVKEMAAMACPLKSDEQTIEVLYLTLPPEYANGEWLALVNLACQQFKNVELSWAGRRQGEALAAIERELEEARNLQMGLVPKPQQIEHLDTAIIFEPCKWVGGDYVDILPTKDGRVLITVADVCGHGLEAALATTSVHTVVHAAVRNGTGLADMMNQLNEHLLEALPGNRFVTMAALMIDPKTGYVECINSGHPPPLVVSADGEQRQMQQASNLPLGVAPIAPEGEPHELDVGDSVLLYSDGLIELKGKEEKMLGIEGLGELFYKACQDVGDADDSARKMTNALFAKAKDRLGEKQADDDWTLLALRKVS